MFRKRKFLAVTAALTLSAVAVLSPALAAGGNDPIGGIDIIILKDPSFQRIKPFSFEGSELEKLNTLQGADRSDFVLETIAAHMGAGAGFVKSGMGALGKIWCADCKLSDRFEVTFPHEDATYTVGINIKGGEPTRPTRLPGKVKAQSKLDATNPKAQTLPNN